MTLEINDEEFKTLAFALLRCALWGVDNEIRHRVYELLLTGCRKELIAKAESLHKHLDAEGAEKAAELIGMWEKLLKARAAVPDEPEQMPLTKEPSNPHGEQKRKD